MKIQDVWFVLSFMALLLFVICSWTFFSYISQGHHLSGPPRYASNVLYLPLEQQWVLNGYVHLCAYFFHKYTVIGFYMHGFNQLQMGNSI